MGKKYFLCRNCEEGNILVDVNTWFVSHDMAMDAGSPELEGSIYMEEPIWRQCECCSGNFEYCERCLEMDSKKCPVCGAEEGNKHSTYCWLEPRDRS